MDFNYNENQKLISEMIRSFSAKEIVPNIKEWDDNQIFPAHVFKKLGELGLMGVLVPQEYGGSGFGYAEYVTAIEELAKVDPSVGLSMAAHNSLCTGHIMQFGNEEQKKKYLIIFEQYFLKSFSSRLAEYTNPEINVLGKKVLSEKYTIVNSLLKGTKERPEIKIDWRIYTKDPENPLIRDLIIEGLSLARTQKEEFSSVLSSNDGDINVLFSNLEKFINN